MSLRAAGSGQRAAGNGYVALFTAVGPILGTKTPRGAAPIDLLRYRGAKSSRHEIAISSERKARFEYARCLRKRTNYQSTARVPTKSAM